MKLKASPFHTASSRHSFQSPAAPAANNQQRSPARKVLDAFPYSVLAIGIMLLAGCGGFLSDGSNQSSGDGLATYDLAGQLRSAPTTMGALEVDDGAGTAGITGIASAAIPQTVSRSLQISWSPLGNNTTGYMVYFGRTADTANVFVSDLPLNSGSFNPSAPAVTYDSARDLGLYAGDTACFRIFAYDMARALSSQSTLLCTAV